MLQKFEMKGLIRGTVRVVHHNDGWKEDAAYCIALLHEILQQDMADAQHVGSTAIAGICSKPIIDIVVGVRNFQDILRHNDPLSERGVYYRKQEHGEQLLYVCGNLADNHLITHHIHVVIFGSEAWKNYLNFRDYMNCHEEDAKAYSELKTKLAEQFSEDRTAYTTGKQEFVENILQKAAKWRKEKEFSSTYSLVTLRERPDLALTAAEWFHSKWTAPVEAYMECMEAYLSGETEYGWYLCLHEGTIVAGLGVIENDFHDRKDLTPNVCAVYTEEAHRKKGIAGRLLNKVVDDMRDKGISPLYLLTDHIGFYERYGWEFLCMVQGDGEPKMSRMYIHR